MKCEIVSAEKNPKYRYPKSKRGDKYPAVSTILIPAEASSKQACKENSRHTLVRFLFIFHVHD